MTRLNNFKSTLRPQRLRVSFLPLHHVEHLTLSNGCPSEWNCFQLFSLSKQNKNPDMAETSNAEKRGSYLSAFDVPAIKLVLLGQSN